MRMTVASVLCSVLLIALTLSASATVFGLEEPPVKSSWEENGVTSGAWYQDPGTGLWANSPVAVPSDPNQYKFELLCLVKSNDFDVACLEATFKCTQGENGHPVQWFESLRAINPPQWVPIEGHFCVYSKKPVDVLEEIAGQIEQEFRSLPVNAGRLSAQPSPHTLRGAQTNFFIEASTQDFDITLLGQKVHVRAVPVQYRWNYGDGSALGPVVFPGGPLPQSRWGEKTNTSHTYGATGDFSVSASTYFQGTYSVNGGPELPIPGMGEFATPPTPISVWRSITRNYADNCLQNPTGAGC